jgi:hypothetical protein
MEYDRSSALLDMWLAYDALSRQTGADRVAAEILLVMRLERLERDQKTLVQPVFRKRPACGVLRRGVHHQQSWLLTGVLLEDSRKRLCDGIRDHHASAEVETCGEGCAAG